MLRHIVDFAGCFSQTRPQLVLCAFGCKGWIHWECHTPETTAQDYVRIKSKENGDFGFMCAKCQNTSTALSPGETENDISSDLSNLSLSDPGLVLDNETFNDLGVSYSNME
jgi:hypothetical protein